MVTLERTAALNIVTATMEWFTSKFFHASEWQIQSRSLNPTKFQRICSSSSLNKLELLDKEEWAKISGSGSAKLIEMLKVQLHFQ